MKVKFWGTRGSIPTSISPVAIEGKIRRALRGAAGLDISSEAAIEHYLQQLPDTVRYTVGGNTSCVEVRAGKQLLILDAGSGLHPFGHQLVRGEFGQGHGVADFLISHTHWDHIQGVPFFGPIFIPGNRFTFHSPHAHLEAAFAGQQSATYFPVSLNNANAEVQFHRIPSEAWTEIGDLQVYPLQMSHPGESYGYRIEYGDTVLVYATDAEFNRMDRGSTRVYEEFFRGADLLIFDAQYSPADAVQRKDRGHSTPVAGAELAYRSGVRRLALFHHDPASDDQVIYASLKDTETYLAARGSACQVMIASEGLEIEL